MTKTLILLFISLLATLGVSAQELQAKININHSKVQGTDASAVIVIITIVYRTIIETDEHITLTIFIPR